MHQDDDDLPECTTHHICDCHKRKMEVLERKLDIAVKYLEEHCPTISFKALVHMAEAHLK